MEVKTFKPGDYCRFNTEEIPSIIELLKANGWEVHKYVPFKEGDNCVIVNKHGGFYTLYLPVHDAAIYELSKHDFMVTALRLQEGDGLRADMSTPEQRRHIAKTLEKLGVKVGGLTNVKTIGVGLTFRETEFYFFGTRRSEINHIDYSDWCKRLNVTPINHIPDVGEKVDQLSEAKRLLRDLADLQNGAPLERHREEWEKTMDEVYSFLDAEPQMAPSNTLNLPDGTTVDLTKPLEVSYGGDKWENDELEFHFVGFNNAGHIIVECLSVCELQAVDKIRNRPEPEFKPGG